MLPVNNIHEKKRFHFDNLYLDSPREYESIMLYQIGDLSCKAGHIVKEHKQFCYEISYIFSGEGYFYMNNEKYKVNQGDIIINVPDGIHKIESGNCDNFRYFYIGFKFNHDNYTKSPFFNIEKRFEVLDDPIKKDRLNINIPFLCALKELRNRTEYSYVMINTYIHQILVLVYRNFFSNWESIYDYKDFTGSPREIAYNVINFIDNNLLKIDELTEISDTLGYSYSYLSHVFKEEMGMTLQSYFAERKLQKAKDFLIDREMTITEISEALHYESIHSFSKAFKKSVGISPREYQKTQNL